MKDEALNALAEKLGVGLEKLWAVLHTMPVYNAAQGSVGVVVVAGVLVVLWRWVLPWARTKREDEYMSERESRMTLVLGTMGVVGLILLVLAGSVVSHLLGLLNPDAYALEYVMRALR